MIIIENLSNFRPKKGKKSKKMNRQLANWTHGKIKDFTIYKPAGDFSLRWCHLGEPSKKCHICGRRKVSATVWLSSVGTAASPTQTSMLHVT